MDSRGSERVVGFGDDVDAGRGTGAAGRGLHGALAEFLFRRAVTAVIAYAGARWVVVPRGFGGVSGCWVSRVADECGW